MADWIKKKKKTRVYNMQPREDQLRAKDTQTESKKMEKYNSGKWK